ncbi:MAG: hypothetical protein ABL856_08065, partial [Gallionella sp.]
MNNAFTDRRFVVIGIIVAIAAIFLLRLFYVQVLNDKYTLSANNNVLRYMTEFPARGLILDRKGKLLVYNEAAYDLMVVPKEIKNLDTNDLCKILNIPKDEFLKRITKIKKYSKYKPSVFERQI